MGKTAAETIAVMMAVLERLTMPMRGSVTFDKPRRQASGSSAEGAEVSRARRDTTFARHTLLRGPPGATTSFRDAPLRRVCAPWQKGGVGNANGRTRRWPPRIADFDTMTDADIQAIAMTLDPTPQECPGFKSALEACPAGLGKNVDIRIHRHVALRA